MKNSLNKSFSLFSHEKLLLNNPIIMIYQSMDTLNPYCVHYMY